MTDYFRIRSIYVYFLFIAFVQYLLYVVNAAFIRYICISVKKSIRNCLISSTSLNHFRVLPLLSVLLRTCCLLLTVFAQLPPHRAHFFSFLLLSITRLASQIHHEQFLTRCFVSSQYTEVADVAARVDVITNCLFGTFSSLSKAVISLALVDVEVMRICLAVLSLFDKKHWMIDHFHTNPIINGSSHFYRTPED